MDIFALTVGFLVGTITGAAGSYLADKYTDQRREQKLRREEARDWADIERRFPKLVAEMREDFSSETGKSVRAFFVKPGRIDIGFKSEPAFEYDNEKHADIRPALLLLEQHGYVSDITSGNVSMYRVHEKLVDRLLG